MVEMARRLWVRGLIGTAEGSLSARFDAHRILCTPADFDPADPQPALLVMVDVKKRWASGGEPPAEVNIHLAAYEARADVQAVIHAHPPVTVGLSVAGETFPSGVVPETDTILGAVAMVPYATPNTEDAPRQMRPFLEHRNVFVLAHHGAVAFGGGLGEACARMETLERFAVSLFTARSLGRVNSVPSTEFVRQAASE